MSEPPDATQAEIQAAVRQYMAKTLGRYVPVAAVLLALLLIIAFVPTKQPAVSGFAQSQGSFGTGAQTGPGGTGGQGAPGATGSGGLSGAGPGGLALGGGGASGTAGVISVPPGITPPAAAGSAGTTRNGVACGPGIRQMPWSPYGPLCEPAYHGNNGGATALGVTASTITLSYRVPNSAQQQAINALAGAANVNNDAYIADLQTFINYFNTQFELYGRKVVLKTFQGQGDYLEEDQGQNLAAAQSDAVTAHDQGSFADVTFPLYSSQYYQQDLASEGVVATGGVYLPNQWFQQYRPFEYSAYSPTGDNAAASAAQTVCHRLAGMPATFTNDPVYSHENRTFGLIIPENAVYQHSGDIIQSILQGCGQKLLVRAAYAINVAQFESQSVNIIAQMRAKGVTSVICACDPLVPIFLARAADQQKYFPEWLDQWWGDPATRNFSQDQWIHAVTSTGLQFPPLRSTEGFKVYQQANPGHVPAEWPPTSPPYFYIPYYTLMQLFDGMQAAGPDLTPATLERGMFSLPTSQSGGLIGIWKFGVGAYDPYSQFTLTRWSQSAVSNFDNTKGAWLACNGGQAYSFDDYNGLGGPHVPASCPPGS